MSKYLGYSDSSHYENGFMKFNPYANNIAYKAFERIDMISEVEIKKLIDRANAVGYSLVDYGFIHPMTALNFILEERTAAKNGTSLADAVIEKNKRSEEAAWVLKNPHVLKCGSTVDCGDARDIIAKMGDAVIKLVEAGKTNGKYSYKTPSSKLDSLRRITQCNDAYNKAKRLSVNVGDLMGQRDYLLSQCNLANIMY